MTILNVAPGVSAGSDASLDEGSALSRSASFNDPGVDDSWTVIVDYGDGSGAQNITLQNKTIPLLHTYPDNGTFTVLVQVVDDDGASGAATFQVKVDNVAPAVAAQLDRVEIYSGESAELSASFSDPGSDDDPWTYDITWGDGATESGSRNAPAVITTAHTFLAAGDHEIRVTVTDKDGSTGEQRLALRVLRRSVSIDVLPGSAENPFKLGLRGNGTLPVAVLSGNGTDAQELDVGSVRLGTTPVARRKNGTFMTSLEDVDQDGDLDLVLHFERRALQDDGTVTASTVSLTLQAILTGGQQVEGTDHLTVMR